MPSALDDPFYYLNNFRTVLDWIGSRYDDLLLDEERAFLAAFAGLPREAQALLVRMVMRKGERFRESKLVYAEIGPTREAVRPLLALGWVDAAPALDLEQLFALLRKPEIAACFGAELGRGDARKAEQLARLQPLYPEPRPFDAWCPTLDDRVYALRLMPLCDRLRLMFFGNLTQDWSEFVLADLGIHQYEQVALEADARGFRHRDDVDLYLHLHQCRERLEADDACPAMLLADIPPANDNPWLQGRRARLLFQLGQQCERLGELDLALAVYRDCPWPGARIRQLRVLERLEAFEQAHTLALALTDAPGDEEERQHLARILPRLQRKLGLPRAGARKPAPVERLDLHLPRPEPFVSVEHSVLAHLSDDDGPVHYVENTLINSLFGLLCWEAIFHPLPGAFFHPFHAGPADLLAPDFHARRAEHFAACLARLDDGSWRDAMRHTYRTKHGLQSPFVYWGVLDEPLLEQALHCLPADHLKHWFRRLLQNIKANRAGLPDLIRFWPGQGRYQMIEVKGPGDRLQDNQLRWLDFCVEHGMPVSVCYVQWADTEVLTA